MNHHLEYDYEDPKTYSKHFCIIDYPFPAELDEEIGKLYKNVFCSLSNIKYSSDINAISVYIASSNSTAEQIMLFERRGASIVVMNEIFAVPANELLTFVKRIFANIADVKMVTFPSVRTNSNMEGFPIQRYSSTEDIVLKLPKSAEEYLQLLGKNTRETVRRFQRRIAKLCPAIEFVFLENEQITSLHVEKLVELNCLRIEGKNQRPSHTAESIDWLLRIAKKYGVMLIAKQNERICGGVICTNVGSSFFMHIIAHDREFDDVRMGKICCYLSICNAIKRGGSEYHMLSGDYDYKYKFLGEKQEFDRINIYRSDTALLSMLPFYIKSELKGRGRMIKKALRKYLLASKS